MIDESTVRCDWRSGKQQNGHVWRMRTAAHLRHHQSPSSMRVIYLVIGPHAQAMSRSYRCHSRASAQLDVGVTLHKLHA